MQESVNQGLAYSLQAKNLDYILKTLGFSANFLNPLKAFTGIAAIGQ